MKIEDNSIAKNIVFVFSIAAIFLIVLLIVNGQGGCERQECYSNQDCIKVQITCCPCNMGGTEQCVSRLMAEVYEDKLKECPPQEKLICTALYNCEIENCACVKGQCGPG